MKVWDPNGTSKVSHMGGTLSGDVSLTQSADWSPATETAR